MNRDDLAAVRRDQILSASARVVARKGFERATLRDVADLASVSTGMVNHYFDNREDLLIHTLVFVSEREQSRIRNALTAQSSGEVRIRSLVKASLESDSGRALVARRVWISALAHSLQSRQLAKVILERRRLFQDLIKDVLRSSLTAVTPSENTLDEVAAELDAFLDGAAMHLASGESLINESELTDSVLQLIQGRLSSSASPVATG